MTTYALNPDQFAALGVISALVVGLLVLIAVGVYRK